MPDNPPARRRVRPPGPAAQQTGPSRSGRSQPGTAHQDGESWEIADLVAVGVLDAVTGQPPVPISVWRATGPDEPLTTPEALYAGLTARVAAILLAIYTDPGDLVLDATADPAIAGAAGAGGRRYRHLHPDEQPAAPGDGAGLVVLRWPAPNHGTRTEPRAAVLEICARSLAPDGHTVAILAPPAGGIYRDHARALIAAAGRAGLGYLQHIVVITGAGCTASSQPGDPDDLPVPGPSAGLALRGHLDLLVLVLSPPSAAGLASGARTRETR